MSDTTPSELAKILADEHTFRLYVFKKLEEGDARMTRIESTIDGAGGVRSGVNDWTETKLQFKGAKTLIIGVVVVLSTIGGAVLFALEVAKWWKAP